MPRHTTARRFDGQVAVVTGASSGIGRRIALDLSTRGATVVGIARRQSLLEELEKKLTAHSPKSATVVCDVADTDGYARALADVEQRLGRIDVLVNDAGVEQLTPVEDGFTSAYRHLYAVNVFGLMAGTLAVLPAMVARRSGVVVNVASDSARAPEPGHGGYASTKAAVAAFSEAVAHEVARHDVHVHVLYPAWVPTAMGMSGVDDGGSLPPKAVRRTEAQVSALLLERMGGPRIDINAAKLPLMAVIGRTLAPRSYQRAMRARNTTGH